MYSCLNVIHQGRLGFHLSEVNFSNDHFDEPVRYALFRNRFLEFFVIFQQYVVSVKYFRDTLGRFKC